MRLRHSMIALTAVPLLGACQANPEAGEDASDPQATESPEPVETVSILRPEIEQPNLPTELEPLHETIGFPQGGAELDRAATAALQKILESDQVQSGMGPIILAGHTDAGGSDAVNERVSRERAEAVRDWLIERGVDEARFSIRTLGENNPVEPNAMPDGSPNEAGRAANRRVEIHVVGVVDVIGKPAD